MDYKQLLSERGITFQNVPYGLISVQPGTDSDFDATQEELGVCLPEVYRSFSTQIGPGVLGRVRIFCPISVINFADLRVHNHRLKEKFRQEDFNVVHSFPLLDLVFFAQDVKEDFWFGWRVEEGHDVVYLLNEEARGPPPKVIAESFDEFLFEVCLGDKLERLGLRKFYDGVNLHEPSEDDWTESDEDDKIVVVVEYELPKQVFRPFPGGQA